MPRADWMIEQHGNSYRVVWRFGGRKQSVTAPTIEDARAVRGLVESKRRNVTRDQVRAILDADDEVAGELTGQYCTRYVEALTGIEDGTRNEYRRIVTSDVKDTPLGMTPLPAVTREKVKVWIQAMERRGLAPKTIANYHSLLSAAMSEAVLDEIIRGNPCRGVRLPRRDTHTTLDEHVYLEPAEVRLIASELPDWCMYVPMLLADTGLRWGELVALQVGDVDVLGGTLRVARALKHDGKIGPPKSEASRRTVVIGDEGLDILAGLTSGRHATEWVVTSTDGRSMLPRSTFMRHWTAALYGKGTMEKPDGGLFGAGAIEKRPHIHSLRHTHASWLISHGASPAFVQAQLGHEDVRTTMKVYAHLMPNTRDDVRQALRKAKAFSRDDHGVEPSRL